MSTLYSISEMNLLACYLDAAGYTSDDIHEMRQDVERLKQFKDVLKGQSEIIRIKHIVDLDSDPWLPEGWEIEEHIQGEQFEWEASRVKLFTSRLSEPDKHYISGHNLRKKVAGKPVFNVNLMVYLLDNQHLIPEAWKVKAIFFWGTILCHLGKNLYVSYMVWKETPDSGHWVEGQLSLDDVCDEYYHAAAIAA